MNVGISNRDENAEVNKWNLYNIGGTALKSSESGSLSLISLDSFIDKISSVDFIKIDVEGFEFKVLQGARNLFIKYKPVIFIEVFDDNFLEINALMVEYGYEKMKDYPFSNYLYMSK